MFQSRQTDIRNRLLAVLPADAFAALAAALERVPLHLHQTIFAPHEPIAHAYFVEDGLCSFVADTEAGRIEIGLVGREGLVGIPVVLGTNRGPFVAMVQAEGEALRIPAPTLREALDASSILRGVLGRYVQSFIVQVGYTSYANVELTIETRLARWLLMVRDRVGQDDLLMTHEFLSMMLGVRRPGVTTALHVLEATGSIRTRRGCIRLLDCDKLRELAGDTYGPAEAEYERLLAQV